jgi:hypothetical protein
MRGKYPDDPEFEEIDPVMRAWMFFSYLQDREDEREMLENQAYLIGSFTNPELVRKMLGDGAQSVSTSDEDFEKTLEMIRKSGDIQPDKDIPKRKRKRKIKE